jgi:septation ring formation regulator EzrA
MTKTSYERARQLRNALDTGITGFERDLHSLHVRKEHFKHKYSDTWRQNEKLKFSLTLVKQEHEKLKNKYKVLEQEYNNLKQKLEEMSDEKGDTDEDDGYYSYRASELQGLVDGMLTKCFEYLHGFSATFTQLEHEKQIRKKGMNVCNQVAKQKLFTSFHDKHHDKSVAAGITFFILQERFTLSWSFMHKAIKVTGPTIRDVSRVLRAKII